MKTKLVVSFFKSSYAALSAIVVALSALSASALPIITNVVETGGDNEATDTIVAKWTGITFVNGVANEPIANTAAADPYTAGLFQEDAPMFVDRNHQYNGAATNLPLSYLVGGEYIMIGNDNRDNAAFRINVTLSRPAIVYLLIDNRLSDGSSDDPPEAGRPFSAWTNMVWMSTNGFTPVLNGLNRSGNRTIPDEIGVDEGGDGVGPGIGLNQWCSVYAKVVPAGTFSLFQPDNGGRNMYGVVVKTADGSPAAVIQPETITVTEGATTTFTALASGTLPLTYQWKKDGVDISGATSRTYTTPALSFTDNGAAYSVVVSNSDGVAGANAALIVTADTTAPTLVSAVTRGNPNGVTITFSEPVSQATAANASNYGINNGATVTSATLGADLRTVTLVTSTLTGTTTYTLTVKDVKDRANTGNSISPNPTTASISQAQGFITRKFFQFNFNADALSSWTNNARFPNDPTSVNFEPNFEYPVNGGNEGGSQYANQFLGFIHPPVTGDYTFYVSGDDQILLYLSTDESPANKRVIASEPAWNNARQWLVTDRRNAANPENRSAPIRLEAGKKYFVEAFQGEGGGGDSLGVAWQLPGVTNRPANGSPPISGAFLSSPTPSGPVGIARQPAVQAVGESGSATFTVEASGTPPYTYQWRSNGVAIAGATGLSFTVASAAVAQSGANYSVEVKNFFSSAVSANAALTVTPDTTAPVLLSASAGPSLNEVTLSFSETVGGSGTVAVTLSGAAERPNPVTTTATGTGTLTLNGNQLSFNISYSGLSGAATGAHFHAPATGSAAAGVVINLQPFNGGAFGASGTLIGTVTLTIDQLRWLVGGLMYVNVHTAANPGGEIRGQVPSPIATSFSIIGLSVNGTTLSADGKSILLATSLQDATTTYMVTANGIKDTSVAANAVAANSTVSFTTWAQLNGYLLREVYTNIVGVAVTDLTSASKFPNSPDIVNLVESFEAPINVLENYGQRVSGFVIAPETGNYAFFISADDNAALYLSTDETVTNKKLIARETAWSNSRQWVASGGSSTLASKRSDQFTATEWPGGTNITLTAGKRYYIEALQKEGGGGDNLGVAWKLPSQPVPTNNAPPISGTFLATAATAVGASLTITSHPAEVRVVESSGVIGTATFTVAATARTATITNVPVSIQWARNGDNIPGATGTSYTTPPLTAANNEDFYVALVSIPGRQIFSRGAALTVSGDTVSPTLVSAKTFSRPDKVVVTFSESVNATATNAANYKINNSVTVASAARTGVNSVELTTSPIISGNLTPYVLTVSGVQDIAAGGNTIVANSTININTTDAAFPSDFGLATAGFQDDFSGTTIGPGWRARGASTNIYSIGNGMLSVANGAGDPNHLLYEVAGYNSTNQEVLVRIRIKEFGNTDASRAGIAVGVATNNSQGINLHFRNNTQDGVVGKQFKLLDDALAWGPAGYKIEWATNTWYWLRLKQTPNTATGQIDIWGKAWLGDGTQPEPTDFQLPWDRYPAATVRSGFAGVTGGSIYAGTPATSASFDVDYILIKAAGLSTVTPGGSSVAIRKALFITAPTPTTSDLLISNRLATALGYVVSHVTAPNSLTSHAQGKDIIIVSSSVASGDMLVGGVHKFRDVAIPVINWETANYDELAMVAVAADGSEIASQTAVNVVRTGHPLAGGLPAGTNVIFTAARGIASGVPNTNAVVIARSADAAARAVLFAYEAGDALFGGILAAERRIGLPLGNDSAESVNAASIALFDAAIRWANPLSPEAVLVQGPAIATGVENATASFIVEANGVRPFTYQWLKNNVAVAGATNRLVTLPVILADNGAVISVRVSNSAGSVTSAGAALTVTAETTAPTVVSAVNNGNPTSVTVVFSEPISATSAVSLANYSINNGVAITGAAFGADSRTVVLTTTPLRDGTNYSLFVSDVTDRAAKGNVIAPNPTRIAINTLQGQLLVEIFTGIGGVAVNNLLSAAKFQNNAPDIITYINGFNLVQSSPDRNDFGARVSGYFTPQSNGVYRFFIRSDDASQLFMNTNNASSTDPSGKVLIAREDACCNAFGATSAGGPRVSPGITMVGGQRYYIEGLVKEGGGGDFLQVAFREAAVTGNPPNTEFIGTQFLTGPTGPLVIVSQPASQTVAELQQAATFSVGAQGAVPVTYQWRANGVAIAGATGSSYTIASATLAQSGTAYSVELKNAFSSAVSSAAVLTVTADAAGPMLASTAGSQSLMEVTLNFSEPIIVLGPVNVTLSGAAERPNPVTTTATGSGTVTLAAGNQLSFNITYSGLSGTATGAHFHGPGNADQAVGVTINLAPFNGGAFGASGSLVGTVTLTADQLNWFQSGLIYANVHTAANPGGEIRGQIPGIATSNFTIAGLTVTSAKRGVDAKSVLLTTTLQDAGQAYTVAVGGVRDVSLAGNLIAANTTGTFTSFSGTTGYLVREVYTGIGGGTVTDLTSASKFPNSPDIVNLVASFQAPTDVLDNYGQRVSGFVIPPETGNYAFFISADDNAALYLSTDETVTNKKLIARETAWSNSRQWVTSGGSSTLTSKRSDQFTATEWPGGTNITLTAGKRYYIEALQKEGGGGDNLAVAWKLPSQASAPADGSAPIAGTFLASASNPIGASITVSKHPDSITVPENSTTTLAVTATAIVGGLTNSPIAFQWARNGEIITGATSASYTTPVLTQANTGDLYVALLSIPGRQLFSRGAVVTVIPDKTPPTLASANTQQRPANVTVVFSEPVSRASATNAANYKINNGVTVIGATQTSPTTVELDVKAPAAPALAPAGPSTNVLISINNVNQLWSYGNTGADLGTAWKEKTFNDSAWPKGPALLAFETGATAEPIRTQLKRTNSAGAFIRTDYFRTHFAFSGDPTTAKLSMRHVVDDGVVVYLNGVEIHRFFMPAGAITAATEADPTDHENAYEGPFVIPVGALVDGDNVLAAEVHQRGGSSSDVVFGLELTAVTTPATTPPPSAAAPAPLAYEGFDYPAGQFIGKGGGAGWAGGWGIALGASPTNGALVQAGSMAYTDSKGNSLLTTGGKGLITGLPGTAQPARDISSMRGTDGTTTWLSFIAVRQGPSTNVTANIFPRGCSMAFFSNAVETIAVGNNSGSPTNAWKLYLNANDSLSQFTAKPYNEQSFVLLRIDHKPGNDDAYLFLNPNLDSEPGIAGALAKSLGLLNFSFNRVRPFAGAQDDANRRPYAELQFDELRVGESFASVAPIGGSALAEFNFDEGGGIRVVSKDGKLAGDFVGAPTFSTDTPSGQRGDFSLQFAAGQRVAVPDPARVLSLATNDPSFTIQAWVKFTTPAARMVFFYNNGPGGAVSASVFTNRTGFVTTLGIWDHSSNAGIPNDGGWHHMAIVNDWSQKQIRFYVDGGLSATLANANVNRGVIFTRTETSFFIGSEPTGGLQYAGLLDRLKYSKGVVPPSALDSKAVPGAIPFSIGLNFGTDRAGTAITNSAAIAGVAGAAQANWNNLSGPNGTNSTLVGNASGTAVPLSGTVVRWTSAGTWASSGLGEENNRFPTNSADRALMTGYLDMNAANQTNTITITNIPPQLLSGGYDLYVYAMGGVGGRGGGYRVLDGATRAVLKDYVRAQSPTNAAGTTTVYVQVPAPPGATNWGFGNYIVFGGLTASSIILESTTAGGLGFNATARAPVNAIQLVAIPAAGPVVPPLPGGLTLTVNGIQDLSSQPNTIAANSQIGINAGFSAGTDTLETMENKPITVPAAKLLANDSVSGVPTVSFVNATSTQGGTIVLAGGNVTYSPKANFKGADSFTYVASGAAGSFAFGTVNVTVVAGNAPAQNLVAIVKSELGPVISQFLGIPGRTYKVQGSTDLTTWTDIGTAVASSNGIISFIDNDGGKFAQRFYRTVSP